MNQEQIYQIFIAIIIFFVFIFLCVNVAYISRDYNESIKNKSKNENQLKNLYYTNIAFIIIIVIGIILESLEIWSSAKKKA